MNEAIKLSERERKCLAALADRWRDHGDEWCMYFRHIAKEAELTEQQTRRSVRALARKGVAKYVRGLFDDDGMIAGSGYCATRAGARLINPCKTCDDIADMTTGECSNCYDKNRINLTNQ